MFPPRPRMSAKIYAAFNELAALVGIVALTFAGCGNKFPTVQAAPPSTSEAQDNAPASSEAPDEKQKMEAALEAARLTSRKAVMASAIYQRERTALKAKAPAEYRQYVVARVEMKAFFMKARQAAVAGLTLARPMSGKRIARRWRRRLSMLPTMN